MTNRSLRIAAAYYALGLAKTDHLINSADEALNDGVYSQSFGELYSPSNPTWADCSPLFLAALNELNISVPDRDTAIITLLEFHLIRMIEGEASERESLEDLYSIHESLDTALEPLRPFIDRFYAIQDHYDYQSYRTSQALTIPEHESLNQLLADVRTIAFEWCQNQWRSELDESWLTSDVQALGKSILYSKAFELLPIFADALQDAGCENESILGHLRGGTMHVRGCVFVEMILNRKLLGNKR